MMELCKGTIIRIIYNIKVAANIYRKNYILYYIFYIPFSLSNPLKGHFSMKLKEWWKWQTQRGRMFQSVKIIPPPPFSGNWYKSHQEQLCRCCYNMSHLHLKQEKKAKKAIRKTEKDRERVCQDTKMYSFQFPLSAAA